MSRFSISSNVSTIVHLDVDAFYVACERELRPELKNRPLVVSQYNPYGNLVDTLIEDPARVLYDGRNSDKNSGKDVNGSLIAVSYEARAKNIKRNDRGLEAIKKCPEDLVIVEVPKKHGKANLTIYRSASERVMAALAEFMKQAASSIHRQVLEAGERSNTAKKEANQFTRALTDIKVEKASVDEIYIDISLPVQVIVGECRSKGNWKDLYAILTSQNGASTHTTIGGLETSKAALATNSLSKDDIRKGSAVQVLDSNDAASMEDVAAMAWWARPFPQAWSKEDIYLAVGSLIALQARQSIVQKFDGIYTLSAGISINKVMSKLASGLKKPNRQTLINPCDETTLQKLFHPLPIGRIRGLGGKFGDHVEEVLQIKTVGELSKFPLSLLKEKFGEKQATFLFRTAQGCCDEVVAERTKSKRVGAGKTFRGVLSFRSTDHDKLHKWVKNLTTEVVERTSEDATRYAKTLTCGLHMEFKGTGKDGRRKASQSAPIPHHVDVKKLTDIAFRLAREISDAAIDTTIGTDSLMVTAMEITASNFVSIEQGSNSILDAFQRGRSPEGREQVGMLESTHERVKAARRARSFKNPKEATGITAFLKPTTGPTNDDAKLTYRCVEEEGALPCSSKKSMLSDFRNACHGTNRGVTVDATDAVVMRKQIVTVGVDEKMSDSGAGESAATVAVDPDMEYAKQLQASFDRESAVISSMEQRRSFTVSDKSTSLKAGTKRQSTSSISSISTFFKKVKRT